MESVIFAAIVVIACFVQAVAGFGLPMIAMPVLVALLGIQTAVPLTAIIILELQLLMIVRYRMALNVHMVTRISAAAVLGIPVGILFLSRISEIIVVTLLGLLLIFYALYALFKFPVPALYNPQWAYLFGFLGGIGGGAYNMAAPALIIYGDTQRWPPDLFKANLQGCFLIIGVVAILTHALNGHVSGDVLQMSLIALPLVLIGAGGGFFLDRYINAAVFRKIVLALMLVLGISLIVSQ
ncbi:MAG: sulfite exporter TauE/SafE family protein [Candidatus Promineifilaceae bacterium]